MTTGSRRFATTLLMICPHINHFPIRKCLKKNEGPIIGLTVTYIDDTIHTSSEIIQSISKKTDEELDSKAPKFKHFNFVAVTFSKKHDTFVLRQTRPIEKQKFLSIGSYFKAFKSTFMGLGGLVQMRP